jgi:alanine racemase
MEDAGLSRCWAEIDCAALRHNARVARSRVGERVALAAVVKANAYGHGLGKVAETLAEEAQLFAVANLDEALELRRHVADRPVLILGPALPGERAGIVENGFVASVSSYEEAAQFDTAAQGATALVNLVVDTGMGRMGCQQSDAADAAKRIAALANTKLHSISTHLPVADEDPEFTRAELQQFGALTAAIRREVPGDYKTHVLLSAGALAFNEAPSDIVRAGLLLYGISPLPAFQELLRPALTLKARVVLVREVPAGTTISYGRTFTAPRAMRVATISAGYADGYPRSLSNRGAAVLIGGRRCDVLGRVTMDLIVADVSHVPDVEPGAEVVLIGTQGSERILASELAQRAGTIPWEILTGIGSRVRRVYV